MGRSGHLLDTMLADAGFEPGEVRVTNAVRCRPPVVDRKQVQPTPAQIAACSGYLAAEIESAEPSLIISMGDVALRALTGRSGVGSHRGKSVPLHSSFGMPGREVWPTFHPAFVLRAMDQYEATVVPDLRRIRTSQQPEVVVPYRVWDGSPLFGDLISFDIETTDAEGKIVDEATQVSVASRADGVIVTTDLQGMSEALYAAQARGATTIGHNSWQFDIPKLREHHVAGLADGMDTMILMYLDGETQPRGLEAGAVRYLGARGWKEDGYGKLGTESFRQYNARDAWYTLLLAEHLLALLGPKRRSLAYLMLHLRRALDECRERGLPVDQAEVERVRALRQAEVDDATAIVRAAVEPLLAALRAGPPPDGLGKSTAKWLTGTGEHNPQATEQVALILQSDGYKLPRTPSGKLATGVGILQRLNDERPSPYIAALLDRRKAQKIISTYVEPYQVDRVHPKYGFFLTTNRTSCSSPNVQNLPRELHYFPILKVDYSAIEFRTGAWCAREHVILDNYRRDPKWDPHTFFAAYFLYHETEASIRADHKANPHNSKRQIAKSANFSQEYDGTWRTIQEYAWKTMHVLIPENQCRWIHEAWHGAFRAFRPWKARTEDALAERGYIETATGFRRHFGDLSLMGAPERAEAVRQAMNCLSQTLAAHIAYIGLVECRRLGLPINGFFHDAIGFEIGSPTLWEREAITHAMTEVPPRVLRDTFGVAFDCPLVIQFSSDE